MAYGCLSKLKVIKSGLLLVMPVVNLLRSGLSVEVNREPVLQLIEIEPFYLSL